MRPTGPSTLRRVEFGAHVSSSGGIDTAIDRIEAIGGDCAQVFTQSPRMWRPTNHKPEAIARFKERRAEAGIGGIVVHALYLCNLATTNDEIYDKSVKTLRTTIDAASAIEADAVIFHVGSHLGAGFEAGLDRTCAALEQILERCDGDTWLCIENSAGAGGTIGRSLEELERDLRRRRRPSAARRVPRLVPPLRVGLRRHRLRRGRRSSSSSSTARSASTGCARCTSTTAPCRSARTATGTRTSARA